MINGRKFVHPNIIRLPHKASLLFLRPRCADTDPSFATLNSEMLMEYKLSTLQKLNEFNDTSIPENSTLASLKNRRMAVAKRMLGQMGKNASIEQSFFVTWGCNTFIGDDVYINRE